MRVEKKRLTARQQPNHSKNFKVRLRKISPPMPERDARRRSPQKRYLCKPVVAPTVSRYSRRRRNYNRKSHSFIIDRPCLIVRSNSPSEKPLGVTGSSPRLAGRDRRRSGPSARQPRFSLAVDKLQAKM